MRQGDGDEEKFGDGFREGNTKIGIRMRDIPRRGQTRGS